MQKIIVVYDACVLYPAPLRDLLMHLAITGLYQAKWTNAIHDEWIRNVLANRTDLKQSQLERTRALMNKHVLDCLVEGYEHLIPSIKLPDSDDRHVLAAAIHSSASIILTYNLKDFPANSLSKYGIKAQDPDKFLTQLLDIEPDVVCSAIKRLRTNLKNPPTSIDKYLEILEKQSLPNFVKILRKFSNLLF
jgi:PIN domain-containing protein